MTPDEVKLVQQSFSKVAPISDQAAMLSNGLCSRSGDSP